MKKCQYEAKIDPYLLGQLPEEQASQFEEHYFNCQKCFSELVFRNEVIKTVKSGIWTPTLEREPQASFAERFFGAFTPARWAAVAASAVLVFLAVWMFVPKSAQGPPNFVLSENQVLRGGSIVLVTPNVITRAPEYLEWMPLGEDLEYNVSISNGELIWSISTYECRVKIPDSVRRLLIQGLTYNWQVKAFSKSGTFIAASPVGQFKIAN